MIANNNIDYLTLKNTSAADIIPHQLLIWLYIAALTQPFFYSLIFWILSENIATAIIGFLLGTTMLTIWVSYDSGFIRALNRFIYRSKWYKDCHHRVRTICNHIDSALHLFLVFILPPISVVGISVYAITTLLLTISPSLN